MKEKKRDYNLDFLRGITTLCIILIHTTWWSGRGYLPLWFSNLTLIVDVPVFIFISGISFNYVNSIVKNLKSLLIQWKKWLYFLVIYSLILICFNQFILKDFFSQIIYIFPSDNVLRVVGGSMWYMLMYIKVTILCSIIICSINYFVKNKLKVLSYILGMLLFIFLYCSSQDTFLFFDKYLSFYSFIYLLGYILHNYELKSIKELIILEAVNFIALVIIFIGYKISINNIQDIKFPPTLPYLPFAFMSIILYWYLKDNLKIKKDNKIVYIGKNAIFYYFAQGISSSLIVYIYPYIPTNFTIIKFIGMLLSNLVLSSIIAYLLDKGYTYLSLKIKNYSIKNIFNMLTNKKNSV